MDGTVSHIRQALEGMRAYSANQREAKDVAEQRIREIQAETLAVDRQASEDEAQRNVSMTNEKTEADTLADAQAKTALVAQKVGDAARMQAQYQYATSDILRDANTIANTVRVAEIARGSASIDKAARDTAVAMAAGTASAIATAAKASTAVGASEAANKVATAAQSNFQTLVMRAQMAENASATASKMIEELQRKANDSAQAVIRATLMAKQDQDMVDRSQAAMTNIMKQAIESRRAVMASSAAAAANMTLVTLASLRNASNFTMAAARIARDSSVKAAIAAAFQDVKVDVNITPEEVEQAEIDVTGDMA